MGPIEEADPIPTTEPIFVQVPRAEHQEEIEHQPEEMNPNRDGIKGPLIVEPEANHGESVTPSNDAQIAPLQRLSFQMSILLKLAKVSDLLALLQPIWRLQDLHLNLHRFPRKAKHYLRWIIYLSKLLLVCHKPSWLTVDIIFNLRLLGLEQEWKKESCPYLLLQPVPPPDMKECPIIGGWYVLSVQVWGTPIKEILYCLVLIRQFASSGELCHLKE